MAVDLSQVDLTDLETFARGFPHEVFRAHREHAPVWWHAPTPHTPDGEGFWSVAAYDDVLGVLHDPSGSPPRPVVTDPTGARSFRTSPSPGSSST